MCIAVYVIKAVRLAQALHPINVQTANKAFTFLVVHATPVNRLEIIITLQELALDIFGSLIQHGQLALIMCSSDISRLKLESMSDINLIPFIQEIITALVSR